MPRRISAESVDHALDHAKKNGWLARWERHVEGGYVVDIPQWGTERLKTTREGHIFALGIAAVARNQERGNH